ncbi:MAG: histidine kinase, partial [Actinomycetota bacterium]
HPPQRPGDVGLDPAEVHLRWIETDVTWTLGWVLVDGHLILLAWLILAFPTGRLLGPERRFVLAAAVYFFGLAIAGHVFEDPWPGCDRCPSNLLLVRRDPDLNDRIWELGQLGNLIVLGAFVALVIHKRNGASAAARRALSPVTWALAPIAVALAATFAEPVVGFGTTGARTVAVAEHLALSAFPLALLAGSVRTRLDRSRVAHLARAVDETSDPADLEQLVGETLGDPAVRLAFRSPTSGDLLDAAGRPLDERAGACVTPIRGETGEQLGAILHDPAVDPPLVDAVAATVALAVRNESLRAELRHQLHEVTVSRRRLAEATVVERQRIERDLHDGAQQGLLALAASLSSVRLEADGPVAARLEDVIGDLRVVIDELRDLARGVHPPILTERGLVAAIESLAERSPIPVSVAGSPPRCRPMAEAAAYFVVAEALTNATRHADASAIAVEVAVTGGCLRVTVSDDGHGGAGTDSGSGLRGLVDRVEAVGGIVRVVSPPEVGTTIEATLPCE